MEQTLRQFQGTKGVWRLSQDGTEITVSRPGILESSKCIATINEYGKPEKEIRANGTLLAAADFMLLTLTLIQDAENLQQAKELANLAIEQALPKMG